MGGASVGVRYGLLAWVERSETGQSRAGHRGGGPAQQVAAADRPVENVCESVFAFERVLCSFIRCFSRAAAELPSLCGPLP